MAAIEQTQHTKASNVEKTLSIETLTKDQLRKLQTFSKKKEWTYTSEVMVTVSTAAMTVRFPAYYWIWHCLRTFIYLPMRYFRFRKNGWELYLLDWCYIVTYMTISCGILAFLRITFGIHTPLEDYNGVLIRAAFSMSCGPLIWAIYIFRNSIVFHDVDHMTSVFIHISPFLLMWCLRWGSGVPSVIYDTFPEMFEVCTSREEFAAADACFESLGGVLWCDACSAPFTDFVVPPTLLYLFVWAVPYYYFVLLRWSDWIKETKRETLHSFFVETNPGLNAIFEDRLVGLVGSRHASGVGYMIFHFLMTITLSFSSYFLWHSFLLHTVVFFFILLTAVHNGSKYMFRVFAYRYAVGELKKHRAVLE